MTKEIWSKINRIRRDDEPHHEDLKWFGTSKDDFLKLKRRTACVNAFGCDFQEKMRKYWNAFRGGCKGNNFSEMGCVVEEGFEQ